MGYELEDQMGYEQLHENMSSSIKGGKERRPCRHRFTASLFPTFTARQQIGLGVPWSPKNTASPSLLSIATFWGLLESLDSLLRTGLSLAQSILGTHPDRVLHQHRDM